jgi:hypothetical protein
MQSEPIRLVENTKLYEDIKKRIWSWVKTGGDADFSDRDIDHDLDLIEPEEKAARADILARMVREKLVEKIGRRRGWYRHINRDLALIDYRNADVTPFNIQLPLGISAFCRLYPKSLIAISGEKNSGKSAYCLNIVKFNQNRDKQIFYFSSEMLETEFRVRLEAFRDMRLEDWNFNPVHRTENFEDVVDPDGINIIDFLEVHDEFWKVGQKMSAIFKQLNTGIAIVCVQKNPNQEHGRGGTFLIEKPRLTLSLSRKFNELDELDGASCTVTNCKFPNGKNLNGLTRDYKILNGSEIVETGPWYRKK